MKPQYQMWNKDLGKFYVLSGGKTFESVNWLNVQPVKKKKKKKMLENK